jgi:hypothetical protein
MVVIASRQPGSRPETIRTRLARFMPKTAAAGWSVGWSAQSERPAEIRSEDELAAADHLGCYGTALSHVLAQGGFAPIHLRLVAETEPSLDGSLQPITVQIHAQMADASIDMSMLEDIARQVETDCSVWQRLSNDDRVQVVMILNDAEITRPVAAAASQPGAGTTKPANGGMRSRMPKWVTPRITMFLAVAVVGLAGRAIILPG